MLIALTNLNWYNQSLVMLYLFEIFITVLCYYTYHHWGLVTVLCYYTYHHWRLVTVLRYYTHHHWRLVTILCYYTFNVLQQNVLKSFHLSPISVLCFYTFNYWWHVSVFCLYTFIHWRLCNNTDSYLSTILVTVTLYGMDYNPNREVPETSAWQFSPICLKITQATDR